MAAPMGAVKCGGDMELGKAGYLPLPVHTLIYKQEKGTGRGRG